MKKLLWFGLSMLCITLSAPALQAAEEEFYGLIESRPETTLGVWVVSGRQFNVTKDTELEEKHGPLVVGACVEVEIEDGLVEEIETKKKEKCAK